MNLIKKPTQVTYRDRSVTETQNYIAFAALREDGSVVYWGDNDQGSSDISSIQEAVHSILDGSIKVETLYCGGRGFAAIREDGSAVLWMNYEDPTIISSTEKKVISISSDVTGFAGIYDDGSVFYYSPSTNYEVKNVSLANGAKAFQICALAWGFAVIGDDGSITTDAGSYYAPSSASENDYVRAYTAEDSLVILKADGSLLGINTSPPVGTNFISVASTNFAYAAIDISGNISVWGSTTYGAEIPDDIKTTFETMKVESITTSVSAFAALGKDGSIASWGHSHWVYTENDIDFIYTPQNGIKAIYIVSTWQSFAAILSDGSVIAWGGDSNDTLPSSVKSELSEGVVKLFATSTGEDGIGAFAALKSDGSVVTWGTSFAGGDSSSVSELLTSDVVDIYSNGQAFAALKTDGTVVTWGSHGGDSSSVTDMLNDSSKKVVTLANYQTDESLFLPGTSAQDDIQGGQKNDLLMGLDGNDSLEGNDGNDLLYGGSDADTVLGGVGDDVLNGGAGSDSLTGGLGADNFVLAGNDVVTDFNSTQSDLIDVSALLSNDLVTFSSVAGLLNLSLSLAAVKASAGSSGTEITSGSGADSLTGGLGADSLAGGLGSDTLVGGAGNDLLRGGAGNDTLIGGAGDDTLMGGAGNDTYVVDSGFDVVNETVTGSSGTDAVQALVASYKLGNSLENLSFMGNGNFTGTGNTAANSITGGKGNDTLDGGANSDTLIGGLGNDTYLVGLTTSGKLEDTVIETSALSTEIDTIKLSGSSTNVSAVVINLSPNIENIDITSTTSSLLNLTGNTLSNTLIGNIAVNNLLGGLGNDTLDGGSGAAADIIDGGDGSDTVSFISLTTNLSTTGVTLNLGGLKDTSGYVIASGISGSDKIKGIENILGSTYADIFTGDTTANMLNGGNGADALNGGAGNDTLLGGLGNDTMTGGMGNDVFVFNSSTASNIDTIMDFAVTTDKIHLSKSIFTNIGNSLTNQTFYAAPGAVKGHDADDRVIYNATTGALYYDADGNGSGAAVQIAIIGTQSHPKITHMDFVVTT
jgi:Ca2+-binding RTX toxin-like protein